MREPEGAFTTPTLRLTVAQYREIVAHCYDGLPDEACGLLAGPAEADGEPTGVVTAVYPCTNADASARTYTVDSRELLRAMRDAESRHEDLVGVDAHDNTVDDVSVTELANVLVIQVEVVLHCQDPLELRLRGGLGQS